MRLLSAWIVAVFAVLLCNVCNMNANDTDKALGVLVKTLDSRKEIKSYHAKAHVRYSENGGSFSEREYLFLRDGKKQRFFFDISEPKTK